MSLCWWPGCVRGSSTQKCGGKCRWAFLSERFDLHQVTTSQNLSLLAVKEAYVPPLSGVSREEADFWEEGLSGAGPVEGTSQSWLPLCPFAAAVTVITALVPGALVLLRLCLCDLVLHLQNIPSFRFSNLGRPGCLRKEHFFPMDHREFRALGGNGRCP